MSDIDAELQRIHQQQMQEQQKAAKASTPPTVKFSETLQTQRQNHQLMIQSGAASQTPVGKQVIGKAITEARAQQNAATLVTASGQQPSKTSSAGGGVKQSSAGLTTAGTTSGGVIVSGNGNGTTTVGGSSGGVSGASGSVGGMVDGMSTEQGSSAQLMAATHQMQEMNQTFNLQYLMLQNNMQGENRRFTAVSNVSKTKHDTAKNSMSNLK
jgi:hypothetical protein